MIYIPTPVCLLACCLLGAWFACCTRRRLGVIGGGGLLSRQLSVHVAAPSIFALATRSRVDLLPPHLWQGSVCRPHPRPRPRFCTSSLFATRIGGTGARHENSTKSPQSTLGLNAGAFVVVVGRGLGRAVGGDACFRTHARLAGPDQGWTQRAHSV